MRKLQATTPPNLEQLCLRVQQWRAQRKEPGGRVPQDLWDAAVQVARVRGPAATSKALHFSYYSLKKRMAHAQDDQSAFVEVQMPPVVPACLERNPNGNLVVELVNRHGDRMRIQASDSHGLDVVGLAQTFWSRQS
jgi:hypothetical protein